MAVLVLLGILLAYLTFVWAVESFVALCLWDWFLIPLGAPSVTFMHMMGLWLVPTVLMAPLAKQQEEDIKSGLLSRLLFCAFVLLMGWIVKPMN